MLWKLKTVTVVIFRAASDMFEKYAGKLNITIRLEVIHRATPLGTESFGYLGTQM